ncbi:MAG: acyltransferase [Burkholderiaceae bacterium]|nr:acyltransferase [Burkholderiaceae bacterium]
MDALHSSNLPWNPRLAHLRFVAALLVLLFHTYHSFFGQWQPHPGVRGMGWLVEGHTGVSLFFVLSGFLLTTIALRAPAGLGYWGFMRNRVLRIFPLFVVVFVVAISIGRDAFRPQDVLYLLFSNLGDAPTSKQFITGAAWTISVEFGFYLVFPFLARFAMAEGPGYLLRLIGLLLLLKVGAFMVSTHPTHMIYSTLLGRMDQFLIGMLAAQLGAQHLRRGLGGGWVLAAAVLMWGLVEMQARKASYFLPEPVQAAWLAWPTIEAVGWACVVVSYAHWRGALWRPLARACEAGGEISYSLYLWHGLVIFLLAKGLGSPAWTPYGSLNLALAGALVLGASWVVASLSYRTIEAPFLRLRKPYLREREKITPSP